MAQEILLEKNGEIKKAYVGFSWTMLFFDIFVSLYRRQWKDVVLIFLLYSVLDTFIVLVGETFLCVPRSLMISMIISILFIEYSEYEYTPVIPPPLENELSFMICMILSMSFIIILSVLARLSLHFSYNTFYTRNLLGQGYNLVEPNEKSLSLLARYNIYTRESVKAMIASEGFILKKNNIFRNAPQYSFSRYLGAFSLFLSKKRRSGESLFLSILDYISATPILIMIYYNLHIINIYPLSFHTSLVLYCILRTVLLYYYPRIALYYAKKRGYVLLQE